jgi:hypothetical protein
MQDSIEHNYVYTICLLYTGQIPSVLPFAKFPQLKTFQRAQSLKSGHPVKDQRLGQQNLQGCTPVAFLRPGFVFVALGVIYGRAATFMWGFPIR